MSFQVASQCTNYEEFGYSCVPYCQCTDRNMINTDGAGLFGPLAGIISKRAKKSHCGSLEVCCQHSSTYALTPKHSTITPKATAPKQVKQKKWTQNKQYFKICSYFGLECINPNFKSPPPKKDIYCKTFQQIGYFCVPYYQCDIKTDQIIIDGLNLIDIRTDYRGPDHGDIVQSKCCKNIEVCCGHPSGTDSTAIGKTKGRTFL